MSDTTQQSRSIEPSAKEARLDIKGLPDLNLGGWGKWGFDVTEVLRATRRHAILQPRESTVFESGGPDASLILRGEWYLVNQRAERRMEGLAWVFYFGGVVFFAAMLQAIRMNAGIVAAGLFVLMYILIEGFATFMLRMSGGSGQSQVRIPFGDVNKMALIQRQGIVLLGWKEGETGKGVALKMHPDAAASLGRRIDSFAGDKHVFTTYKNETLAGPPK